MKIAHTAVTGIGLSEIDFSAWQGYLSKIASGVWLSVTGGKVICHEILQLIVLLNSTGRSYASVAVEEGCFHSLLYKGFGVAAAWHTEGVVGVVL